MDRLRHTDTFRSLAGLGQAILLLVLCTGPAPLRAADIPLEFEDPALQARYLSLLEELRCLVCQNQSLADSNAPLAQDLREEVYQRIRAGVGDREIIEFLVARYGEFVLYRPPLGYRTLLLWFGPFLLLLLGAGIVIRIALTRGSGAPPALSPQEQEQVRELLNRSAGKPRS